MQAIYAQFRDQITADKLYDTILTMMLFNLMFLCGACVVEVELYQTIFATSGVVFMLILAGYGVCKMYESKQWRSVHAYIENFFHSTFAGVLPVVYFMTL